ncbi:MAG: hypothetical protein ACOYOP_11315 [Microthrixaceae bacterium]
MSAVATSGPGPGPGADTGPGDGTASPVVGTPPPPLARLRRHAVLLALVLGVLAAWSAVGGQAITDEGSVLAQADLLSRGTWSRPAAIPDADPAGRFPAMETANVADGREYPYVKHVTYPALLAALSVPFGGAAAAVCSAAGVWLAAVGAALLTRRAGRGPTRVDPAVVTLWATALLTPLVFDAGVAMAVGPAAGLVAMVALGLVAAGDAGAARGRRGAAALLAAVAAAAAVLLRSEALLAVGALGAVAALVAFAGARPRAGWRGVPAAAGVVAAGALAYLVDGRLTAHVLGSSGLSVFTTSDRGADPLAARAAAVWSSVLRPGFEDHGIRPVLLVVAAAAVLAAAWMLRRDGERRAVAALAVAGAVAATLAVWSAPGLVTGLVPAAPVLVAGLLLVRRADLAHRSVGLPLAGAAVAAVAVLALSYPDGGGAEWGGRYLHVLVPLAVPAAVLGWARLRGGRAATVTAVALVVAAGVLSFGALATLAGLRDRVDAFLVSVTPVLRDEPADPSGAGPIVVTDRTGLGRFAWRELDDLRLVTVPVGAREDLRAVAGRLDASGVRRWSLVQAAGEPLPWGSGAPWTVTSRTPLGAWEVVSVARR